MTYDKWKTTEPDRHEEYFPPDEITDEREELYAEVERLRAYNAALLSAAKMAFGTISRHSMPLETYNAIHAAITAAEEP